MIGSTDCCKWQWKNCPTAHHGQYKGKESLPTNTIVAVSDDRLYFWHIFFGTAGCNNDVTVFSASTMSAKMSKRTFPRAVEYEVSGKKWN